MRKTFPIAAFPRYTPSYAESPRGRFAMRLTDPNGLLSFEPRRAGSGRSSHASRIAAAAVLFFTCATIGAGISRAQDQQEQSVAEAACQERARKQELQKRAKHVYTEEDLKHPNILTPEDRAQVEAKRNECAQKNNCSPAAPQNPPASLDANAPAPAASLGEVARQLRQQKELQALKPKQSEPFHLPFSTPALASPISPERPAVRPPSQPVLQPKATSPNPPSNVFRRDPFARVPTRPQVPLGRTSEIRPALRPSAQPVAPAAPKISSGIAPALKFLASPQPAPVPEPSQPKSPALRIQPIHPSAPLKNRRTILPSLPANIFPAVKPVAPILLPGKTPAPLKTIQPAQPARHLPSVHSPSLSSPSISSPSSNSAAQTIRIQPGDSLWKLAQRHLGHAHLWPAILAANSSITDPDHIRSGARLNLPAALANPVPARPMAPSNVQVIKVRKGDTLWALAKSNLGRSTDWPCVAQANPAVADANRIFAGQSLVMPTACSSGPRSFSSRASP
jgi:nucleoid-associated protein YgaU